MLELFAVAPEEDDAFLAAWAAERPPGAALYKALRADAPLRFASVPESDRGGVLLIVAGTETLPDFTGCRGHRGTRRLHDRDGRPYTVVHWSSPLMYHRAPQVDGALYAPQDPDQAG